MDVLKNIDLQVITNNTSTNSDGDLFYDFLSNNAVSNAVIIKIDGNLTLSTSFLNSSFGRFINIFGIDLFKSNIKIKSNSNTYNRLKLYVDTYSELHSRSNCI